MPGLTNTVDSVEDFIECLKAASEVFDNTVRVSKSERPINGADGGQPTAFQIVLQATTLVRTDGGEAEYLLQAGVDCGTDYRDATLELTGTETFNQKKAALVAYLEERKWKVLPGILSID